MFRILILLPCFAMMTFCASRQLSGGLPKPHYHPDASDPEWLVHAVQFHGHLGPWAAAGLRAGMAGRNAAGAEGYFDVEVTVEGPMAKPPQACFLDGLQVSTGATLGKRNLKWIQADEVVVRVKDTHTGKVAEIRPTEKLLELLASFKPRPKTDTKEQPTGKQAAHAHDRADDMLETIARKIAHSPEEELLRITFPDKDE